jgi:hypothetical protein
VSLFEEAIPIVSPLSHSVSLATLRDIAPVIADAVSFVAMIFFPTVRGEPTKLIVAPLRPTKPKSPDAEQTNSRLAVLPVGTALAWVPWL